MKNISFNKKENLDLQIHPDVAAALAEGRPVVALESTVITHGLPYPQNLELAQSLEQQVHNEGAQPATIAILGGKIHVGIEAENLAHLANPSQTTEKASLWNLAAICAQGNDAGTTVATTLHIAHQVGIAVFATGGIGGVHPYLNKPTYDVSADLPALSRYRLVIVCAGPKSILDVAATKEKLETLGVPIIGYQSDYLAGFHTPQTPYPVTARANSAQEIASIYAQQKALELPQAILVSQPVAGGIAQDKLADWLNESHQKARDEKITGKDLTPFLLEQLAKLSQGETVRVNQDLLKQNAKLAANIANHISKSQ